LFYITFPRPGSLFTIADTQGGRQLDQARTGFDSLRAIHEQDPTLSKQLEIYIDGGVRRGTDVLQALAFGAKGVGLGRTFLWGQAAYGEKGVLRAIRSRFLFPPILPSPVLTAVHLSILKPYSIVKLWMRLGAKLIPVMEDEIIMAMRLLGVRKIDEITPGMVECLKEVWR
jgi:L-lactate dehydrogenase (cytochrome)